METRNGFTCYDGPARGLVDKELYQIRVHWQNLIQDLYDVAVQRKDRRLAALLIEVYGGNSI
jgi:hypothetical protein